MTTYNVTVRVDYTVPIETDNVKYYPPEILRECVTDREVALAMARFDAENSPDPIDSIATDFRVISAFDAVPE